TSPTGGMSRAVNSFMSVIFPAGTETGAAGGPITDTTTGAHVGDVGSNGPGAVGGGLFNGVEINPGDTLRIDIFTVANPSNPSNSYSVQVSSTSDVPPATSNTYAVVANHSVSNVSVVVTGPTSAAAVSLPYSLPI